MIITTATQLQNMNLSLTSDYELGNDIDCSGIANFEPVGGWNGTDPFTGSFDGKGYKITDLVVNRAADDYIGLFGSVNGATIQNVTIETVTLTGDDWVGGLIGLATDSTISNITITGATIVGDARVAGLIAYVDNCTVTNCNSAGTVNGGSESGGLIGRTDDIVISTSHSSCTVTMTGAYGGGLIGRVYIDASATITKCYATGAISGDDSGGLGGLIGRLDGASVSRCYASGAVDDIAGVDARNGGLIGWLESGTLANVYATGAVSGVSGALVGGLVGYAENDGEATSTSITNAYSKGAVSGADAADMGGLIGVRSAVATITVTQCFWDTTTSTESDAVGTGDDTGITGHITATMKMLSTFSEAGWSIPSIWNISSGCTSGYPCLVGVNPCCAESALPPLDPTIAPKRVSLELIRNLEMMNIGRAYVDKSGNFTYESRYSR